MKLYSIALNSSGLYVFATVAYKCHLNVSYGSGIMALIEFWG
ncbi:MULTISPECIES: hypothetical protein [unclassified Pseudoalteromonas]|nr:MULTISPECIES: hypothetical protein [unclassified Pseudoalteromonas]